jgi:hypothetical protein
VVSQKRLSKFELVEEGLNMFVSEEKRQIKNPSLYSRRFQVKEPPTNSNKINQVVVDAHGVHV